VNWAHCPGHVVFADDRPGRAHGLAGTAVDALAVGWV
jgi:hypothetical protein